MTYPAWRLPLVVLSALWPALIACGPVRGAIPLPEHPRPDFQRPLWKNLNGPWQFRFDTDDEGLRQRWFEGGPDFNETIQVPFSWGSPLSGVEDRANIGWYHRPLRLPPVWQGQRVFVVIGACDWHTTAWIDGQELGEHRGGYTPFEFELTDHLTADTDHRLVLRVDDTAHPFKLEGKQGYGRAAGIWQTVYLEARPAVALETIHFTPKIALEKVFVAVTLDRPASQDMELSLEFRHADGSTSLVKQRIRSRGHYFLFDVNIENPHLWSLDDPFLYEVEAILRGPEGDDRVSTYFGMREIGVGKLPGTEIPYVFLNGKPVYLQMTLDQSFHPQGYYTFPSDQIMRDEILRTRQIGLNGQRVHIKVEIPRKLYWADKLGVLIQADLPNSWGPPSDRMKEESEYALRQMIGRDYNHPSIFSWVNFNETWGLVSGPGDAAAEYSQETQEWVRSLYQLTKQLDGSRLVEDNSPCNDDHVATDLNSWNAYLPGYAWREKLDQICRDTYPGSPWNFIGSNTQGGQPMLNSECGNVWGYRGGTGDVDWSWDYHLMINEFRRHPQCCGWLYTEHHDVINEWNGYWRADRSQKHTGLEQLVPGMSLKDLHAPLYLSLDRALCTEVKPGQLVTVPIHASFMSDQALGSMLSLEAELTGWDRLGQKETYWKASRPVAYEPWQQRELTPLQVPMPEHPALALLAVTLRNVGGAALHRNFTTYLVDDGPPLPQETILLGRLGLPGLGEKWCVVARFAPNSFTDADWSMKQWQVLEGLKVNGAGAGHFEYQIPWPTGLDLQDIEQAALHLECSAKQLFGKDRANVAQREGDFMRREGPHDPSLNPNAYPMTDDTTFPSQVRVRIAGEVAGAFDLPDDPADHRGILSWFSQRRDGRLREAGSYGYLIRAPIPTIALKRAFRLGKLTIRLEVDEALSGGLAIYGRRFGRYPLDPTLVFVLR